MEANALDIGGRNTNQADEQYKERNKLDLAVPRSPLAKISLGLQKVITYNSCIQTCRCKLIYKTMAGKRQPEKGISIRKYIVIILKVKI